jgi:hypothetical protein
MSSGDVGYLDANGRLFIVDADDERSSPAARTSTPSR